MKKILRFLTFILLFVSCLALRYGRKHQPTHSSCNEFDPPAVEYLNFDDIAGKWHLVRLKTQSTVVRERTTDSKAEWLPGTNLAIRSVRLRHNPLLCSYFLREFKPIPGTRGSAFNLFLEENQIVVEWRLLYRDSEFLLTWGCFNRNKKKECTDWASGVFRNKPNVNITDETIGRLDIISRQKTCKTISADYLQRTITDECRDFALPSKQRCY